LQTLEGALQLQGSGRVHAGRLQFAGFASAAAGREEALANLLNIIGRRDGARSVIQVG
jgi:general secretion pathway protein N